MRSAPFRERQTGTAYPVPFLAGGTRGDTLPSLLRETTGRAPQISGTRSPAYLGLTPEWLTTPPSAAGHGWLPRSHCRITKPFRALALWHSSRRCRNPKTSRSSMGAQ
jgi:hypothetical protein